MRKQALRNQKEGTKAIKRLALPVAIGFVISGCSPAARDQYSEAGQDAGDAAKQTGRAAATDAENAKQAADNTLQTSKVMSALNSASGLKAGDINVDTDTRAGTITLNGSVPDRKQRDQAVTVAEGMAGSEFKVVNNLEIVSK